MYLSKYLKYKKKYLELKQNIGGMKEEFAPPVKKILGGINLDQFLIHWTISTGKIRSKKFVTYVRQGIFDMYQIKTFKH
tara:strand:- start:1834 stop:2070 length:237 start_codon:yes stop_codon:yes gene_type:complete